ncbi:hypothetical protein EDC96DRAFT_261549 [Choanephora cucurbitarum]|nr:hypothetical protein EDC96DRAFT_261549 [Choanephora cucurbitarum]
MTTRSPESYSPSRDAKRRKRTENVANCFKLENNETYEGACPVFQQPRELTSYSIDHNRRVWFDNREMKYYYPPTTGKKDLNEGYERMIQRDESISEHIDTLLDALTHFNSEAKEATTADIVTWRGIMTKILCTPYARREPWELRATRYKDTIYLEEQTTEQKKQQESQATEKQKRMSYWGYRFETLCTLSKPPHLVKKDDQELQDRLVQNVNTNIQYCILVKTKLGSSSIIMGAEVDCCRAE